VTRWVFLAAKTIALSFRSGSAALRRERDTRKKP